MTLAAADLEALLREALSPIDPPTELVSRLERALVSLHELAGEELESWELSAMRDPRNWVRPAAAALVGVGAGTALALLRVRARHQQRAAGAESLRDLAQTTLRDLAQEARRILPER
jgi:hypothetical protein